MTPRRFQAVADAYGRHFEAGLHDAWERMRIASTIIIQPHLTKKITPGQILPLPWDGTKGRGHEDIPSKEEDRKDFERLMAAVRKNGKKQ